MRIKSYSALRKAFLTLVALLGVSFILGNITTFSAEKNIPMKIGFAHVGPVSDEGWTWSHDQGRKAVEKALPGKVITTMVESMPFSAEAVRTLEQFIHDGAKLIVVTSEYADFMDKVAQKHPDVKFLECNGHSLFDNKSIYYFGHWDTSYLIGMAAGMLTKTNKLGYIGAFPTASNYTNANAFQLGARLVNPEVTTQVVLINSWFDPPKATQATNALIDSGVDFMFGFTDEPSYLIVSENNNVWVAGCDADRSPYAPEKYVTSYINDWSNFYIDEAKAVMDGTWEGNRTVFLTIGKGIDIGEWGKNVPEFVKERVGKVYDKMINECYTPFVGPIKDKNGQVRIPAGLAITPWYMYNDWTWSVEGLMGMPN